MGGNKAAAFHEAGHAVARMHVGAPVGGVLLTQKGRQWAGYCEGTGDLWQCASSGQYATWDHLICALAGAYAEARASKRSIVAIALTTASDDYSAAEESVRWLVEHGYARDEGAAWGRAEFETKNFVRKHWPAITAVALALSKQQRLSAEQVRALV